MHSYEDSLIVRRIREGTVIDHIPAGRSLEVLKILGITGKEGFRISIVMNVESKKLGRKDIVKIENRHLKPQEVNKIALVAPHATINIIKDYHVVEKKKVELPSQIIGIINCTNPTCITRQNREPIKPTLKVLQRSPLLIQCLYCGTLLDEHDIVGQLTSSE